MSATTHRHGVGLTWTEAGALQRSAHAVADGDRVWLIDPFSDDAALQEATGLGTVAGVIQLLGRHNRDTESLALRYGCPLLRLPDPGEAAGTPFEVVRVISRAGWREVALWWSSKRTLIVAEALGTAPAFALGRVVGVHPMLRLTPPRRLDGYQPGRLLVGHGPPVEAGATDSVHEALAHSRSDLPQLILKLPGLLRAR